MQLEKVQIYTKKQVEVSGWKITKRNIKGKEKFWLKQLDRILTVGRLGWSDIKCQRIKNLIR